MRTRQIGRLAWHLEFVPADLWIGIYVKPNRTVGGDMAHQVWVCLLPMVPLHFWWRPR